MTYRDTQRAVADRSERALLSVYGSYSETGFITVGAGIVALMNARAAALADLALAARLRRPPLGLARPGNDRDRLTLSLTTLLEVISEDEPDIATAKVARLGRSEPLAAGRAAYHEGMRLREVKGWTRQASPTACELCQSLADGTVLSVDTPMLDHPGCSCIAVPV